MFDVSFEALFDVLFGFAPWRPLIASCRTDAGEPAVTMPGTPLPGPRCRGSG
ncbi:hypothetical protein PMN64_22220 [Bradyrhizobium sp. UFLA01-814]|uniref:hypothetical protein n=1 Tax=Bradyrhizobium sp. UFLA01-814 TaxID=3023480 RepID=UPI00398AD5F0